MCLVLGEGVVLNRKSLFENLPAVLPLVTVMQIFVVTADTTTHTLDIQLDTTVEHVKRALGAWASDCALTTLGGRPLAVGRARTLADYEVSANATLLALPRLRGGLTVFTCQVCRSQMISDAFPSHLAVDPAGADIPGLRAFQSRLMTAGGEEIDTGGGSAFGGASEDEAVADNAERVDAVEFTFQLKPVEMSTKSLKDYLNSYFVALRARMRAAGRDPATEIKPMMASAPAIVTFLLTKNKDCEVFVNAEWDMEGAITLREWTEAGNKYYYIMHGLDGGRAKCGF